MATFLLKQMAPTDRPEKNSQKDLHDSWYPWFEQDIFWVSSGLENKSVMTS